MYRTISAAQKVNTEQLHGSQKVIGNGETSVMDFYIYLLRTCSHFQIVKGQRQRDSAVAIQGDLANFRCEETLLFAIKLNNMNIIKIC